MSVLVVIFDLGSDDNASHWSHLRPVYNSFYVCIHVCIRLGYSTELSWRSSAWCHFIWMKWYTYPVRSLLIEACPASLSSVCYVEYCRSDDYSFECCIKLKATFVGGLDVLLHCFYFLSFIKWYSLYCVLFSLWANLLFSVSIVCDK